jgi:hypothetical protein
MAKFTRGKIHIETDDDGDLSGISMAGNARTMHLMVALLAAAHPLLCNAIIDVGKKIEADPQFLLDINQGLRAMYQTNDAPVGEVIPDYAPILKDRIPNQ